MTAQLRAWAAALGGEVSGRGVSCPGPGHNARDRSLFVTPSAAAPDGFVVHSFSPGDDWQACRDHVRGRLGLASFRHGQTPKVAPQRERKPVEVHANNRGSALNIWHVAVDPRGSLVEQYLKSRALELPDEAANEAIRFHPDCPFGAERFRAMVCLVRNIITNAPQGIHRIALATDGTAIKRDGKTHRLSLGQVASGAIKIDPDEDAAQRLCIGEGVETCLSGRQMGLRPVWSAVNTGGIANFPVVPGVDGLHIFRENDANGASAKAVEACARRWYEAGRDVVVVDPDTGNDDLNDELQEAAR
jgi:putative DNA primase/helicase